MDTMVLIGCPVCGRRYRYDTGRFGRRGVRLRCRSCEAVMRIDLAAGAPAEAADDPIARPGLQADTAASPARPAQLITKEPEVPPDAATVPSAAGPPAGVAVSPQAVLDAEAQLRLEETFGPGAAPRPAALVADRDAGMQELLADVLSHRGFQVHRAADGLEARQALAMPRLEVAFLNAYLPQVLGVTLCAEIKRHPELARIQVVLVGSLYRRDRFVRHPRKLYGADHFLDGNGSQEEVRRRTMAVCDALAGAAGADPPAPEDPRSELARLARIVAGDIILYNARIAEQEIAAGRFFTTFAQEVKEGEALVAGRFPQLSQHRELYLETLREAVRHHGEAAGIPAPAGR